jgi:membrane-associated phospholipid phosphatase
VAGLRAVDRLLLAYLAFTAVVALVRLPSRPTAGWVLAIDAGIATLIVLLARPQAGRLGEFLRDVYPLILLPVLYGSLDLLNGLGEVQVHDAAILRLERALFGGEPARTWWQAYPSRFWSTLLHGAYWLYYPLLAFPVILFLSRRRRQELADTILALTITFVFCYAWFILLPVAGPYYTYPRPSAEFLDNPMARLVYGTLATGSSHGAAFPSSHVAAALVALGMTWRGSRTAGAVLGLPVLLLVVSVVYCQMHYAVDAVAGVLVAGVVLGARARGKG